MQINGSLNSEVDLFKMITKMGRSSTILH